MGKKRYSIRVSATGERWKTITGPRGQALRTANATMTWWKRRGYYVRKREIRYV